MVVCLLVLLLFAVMLKWFVDREVATEVLKNCGKLVVEELEVRPENLPDAAIDENVDIHQIRKYFTSDALLLVNDILKRKQANPMFVCKSCYHDLHKEPSIVGDHCLSWFHIKCVGLKSQPKTKYWYCRKCHEAPLD